MCRRLYQKLVHNNGAGQQSVDSGETACTDIHTGISLKHNHLYNDFAHLLTLDNLLSKQPDLFG